MPASELRLRAMLAELEACRDELRDAVGSTARAAQRRRARWRRAGALVALVATFAAGLALAGGPSFGAGKAPASTCEPGTRSVAHASLTIGEGSVTAHFSIVAGCGGVTVSLGSYQVPSTSFQSLFDGASQTFAAGGPYTLSARLPTCFFQVDLVTGSLLSAIGPASFYGAQLVTAGSGGTRLCPTPPPTTTETTSTTTGTTSTTGSSTTETKTTGTTVTQPTTTATSTTTATTASTPTTAATGTTTTTVFPATSTTTRPVDVAVTKQAARPVANVGEHVAYTLTVVNNGPGTALDVIVVDPLPAQETLVSLSDPACSGTTIVTCAFGALSAGQSRSVTLVTLAQSPGVAINVATVSTTSPETNTANNQARSTVTIRGPFKPPVLCAKLSLGTRTLVTSRKTTLVVEVRRHGAAVAGERVQVRGPGILVVRRTDAQGRARFTLVPRLAGVLRVRVLQSGACPRALAYVLVHGEFRPPHLTG